jgi:hypothetical protein
VLFTKRQSAEFEQLRAAVENALAARHNPQFPAAAPISVADELTKLAALVQQGILSPQEFRSRRPG